VSRLAKLFVLAVATCALLTGTAGATTVVNGSFETGTLEGWQTSQSSPQGNWLIYSGNRSPFATKAETAEKEQFKDCEEEAEGSLEPIHCTPARSHDYFPPPAGTYAPVTEESNPSAMALYQDIAVDPGLTQTLRMSIYYKSYERITVPFPNTLEVPELMLIPVGEKEPGTNQQMRVDVIKPTAPIFTMNPSDILATVFANKNGDPETMAPTTFSADLTPFGGQTVRLRVAVVAADYFLNASVDDVSVSAPSNAFTKGKLKLNKKKGTATLTVTLPGPGVLSLADAKKGKKKRLKPAKLTATAAGKVKIAIKPNGKGKKTLNANGKLAFKGKLTFTPTGGTAASQSVSGKLKLNLPKSK
jgi:hypothetical protein